MGVAAFERLVDQQLIRPAGLARLERGAGHGLAERAQLRRWVGLDLDPDGGAEGDQVAFEAVAVKLAELGGQRHGDFGGWRAGDRRVQGDASGDGVS
jgi:hypothetical protein